MSQQYSVSSNSSCAQRSPPPPPRGTTAGHLPLINPRSGALGNFVLPGGRAFAKPSTIPEFLTRTVYYSNITTQMILLEKQADWLICQGDERVVKACSQYYACMSSLLIKPELHSEVGGYWPESIFFWLLNKISVDVNRTCHSFRRHLDE